MSVKVKICGIRSIDAAITAIDAGANFLGFNFVPNSARYIPPALALEIINLVRGKTKIIGVFQNAKIDYLKEIAEKLGLDFVQLHGKEDNDYIINVGVPVIKSFTIDDQAEKIKADYLLLDRVKRGQGELVDFDKAAKLALNFPLFYAGGLNPENVAEVIREVQPFAVDVAGGVETNGVQDIEKIELFIKNTKGVK